MSESLGYVPDEVKSEAVGSGPDVLQEIRDPFQETPGESELEREENQEFLEVEAAELVNRWTEWYGNELPALAAGGWSEVVSAATERRTTESAELFKLSADSFPKVGKVLGEVNNVFGFAPKYLRNEGVILHSKHLFAENHQDKMNLGEEFEINSPRQAAYLTEDELRRFRNFNDRKEVIMGAGIDTANWQGQTIWTMLALDSAEMRQTPAGPTNFFQEWLGTVTQLYKAGWHHSGERLRDATLSGIYGPLRLGRVARAAGYQPYLPKPFWDSVKKMDMLLVKDNQVLTTQIKTSVKMNMQQPERWLEATQDFNAIERPRERDDFERLRGFTDALRRNPDWKGLSLQPIWAKIHGANPTVEGFGRLLAGEVRPTEREQLERELARFTPGART